MPLDRDGCLCRLGCLPIVKVNHSGYYSLTHSVLHRSGPRSASALTRPGMREGAPGRPRSTIGGRALAPARCFIGRDVCSCLLVRRGSIPLAPSSSRHSLDDPGGAGDSCYPMVPGQRERFAMAGDAPWPPGARRCRARGPPGPTRREPRTLRVARMPGSQHNPADSPQGEAIAARRRCEIRCEDVARTFGREGGIGCQRVPPC